MSSDGVRAGSDSLTDFPGLQFECSVDLSATGMKLAHV